MLKATLSLYLENIVMFSTDIVNKVIQRIKSYGKVIKNDKKEQKLTIIISDLISEKFSRIIDITILE